MNKLSIATFVLCVLSIASCAQAGWKSGLAGFGFGFATSSLFRPCYYRPCYRPVVMVQPAPRVYTRAYVTYPQPTCCMHCDAQRAIQAQEQELNERIHQAEVELERLNRKKQKLTRDF